LFVVVFLVLFIYLFIHILKLTIEGNIVEQVL